MIHGLAELFGAAARTHIDPVDAKPAEQRFVGKTLDVSRIRRAFQAMQKDNLAARWYSRLMFQRENARVRVDFVSRGSCGKALKVDLPRPEVAGNRQKMRISKEWLKVSPQVRLYGGLLLFFALPVEVFGKNDSFCQFAHRPPQAPAFVP